MNFFKEWSLCVCISLVISVVFSLFTPQGNMKSFYKIMLGIFIFVSFIYPFGNFSAADFKTDILYDTFELNENASEGYENQINSSVKKLLSDNNIIGANVSSSADFNIESGELEIKEIVIYLPDEYSKKDVESLAFSELGINARVVNLGE